MITLIAVSIAHQFYKNRHLNDSERKSNLLYDVLEISDLKSMDLRFKIRGPQQPHPDVALLTVDDRSLEEIGRWPWSREKIAHLVDQLFKYKAKSVSLDAIFAEPQTEKTLETISKLEIALQPLSPTQKKILESEKKFTQPDLLLSQSIEKNKDRIVLGVFNNEEQNKTFKPYQDYCRNESFLLANAKKFVKLNGTFIVDDKADEFVDLEFQKALLPIFKNIQDSTLQYLLKNKYNNKSLSQLNSQENNQLQYYLEEAVNQYCETWLTPKDTYLQNKDLQKIYLEVFSKIPSYQNLDFQSLIQKFIGSVKSHPIPQKGRWTINIDPLQEVADYTASFNAEQDTDGTIRKSALFFRTGNRIGTSFIPSLALQSYLLSTGYQARVDIDQDQSNSNQKSLTQFKIYDISKDPEVFVSNIPTDLQGRLRINYAGGRNMFPYVPAKELFTDKETMTVSQQIWNPKDKTWNPKEFDVDKTEFIKDKIFIFGATAIGIYDLRVSPFEKNFPGPETHGNVVSNLLNQNFLKSDPLESRWMIWVLLILGVSFSYFVSHVGAISGFFITSLLLLGLLVLDQILFKSGYIITMILPFFLIANLYVLLTFYKYFTEERKKRNLRATFAKYVSPAIVDEILKDPENVEIGGQKKRMTVFFSDVRGFTTISEKLDPQVLSSVLSRYLTPMTQIVFANKGTLDKYMGDALMAFFGAPVYYEDHAHCACKSALQSIKKLAEIQKQFESEGLPHIDIGIGINTSEMSVGNMGSDIVQSYTVMGDAVNLGSRLEGINKEYGTRIMISEFTFEEIKNSFVCRLVDWVRVKGKKQPVKIYELLDEKRNSNQNFLWLDTYQKAVDDYHKMDFQNALTIFKSLLDQNPNDPVLSIYVNRCTNFINNPPPPEWDGVFEMKSK